MDKRGASDLLLVVMTVVLLAVVTASIFSWIGDVSSGRLIQAQVDAKESALLADMARPGTTLILNNNISLHGNNITAEFRSSSFSYSTFNPRISLQKTDNGVWVMA